MSSLTMCVIYYFVGCNCSKTGIFLPTLQYLLLRDLAENLYSMAQHQVLLIITFIFSQICFRICIRIMTLYFPFAFWSMYDTDLCFISVAVTQLGPFIAIIGHRSSDSSVQVAINERFMLLMEFRTCYSKNIVLWHTEYFKQQENGKYKAPAPSSPWTLAEHKTLLQRSPLSPQRKGAPLSPKERSRGEGERGRGEARRNLNKRFC